MQTASSKIWILVAESTSYDNNCYTISASLLNTNKHYIYIYIYIYIYAHNIYSVNLGNFA